MPAYTDRTVTVFPQSRDKLIAVKTRMNPDCFAEPRQSLRRSSSDIED